VVIMKYILKCSVAMLFIGATIMMNGVQAQEGYQYLINTKNTVAENKRGGKVSTQLTTIKLNYAEPEILAKSIKSLFPEATVVEDSRRRAISFSAPSLQVKKIKSLIETLDLPVAQVSMEVQILEVNSQYLEQNKALLSQLLRGVILSYEPKNGELDLNPVSSHMQHMMESGNAKLLAKPTIVTLDGSKASIKVGDKLPFITYIIHEKFISEEVHNAETGIELEILPKIVSKDQVLTEISANITGVKQWKITGSGEYPILSNRNTQTKVYLKKGETLVIAGLYDEEVKIRKSGIPFVMDIPVLGALFTSSYKDTQHTDVLFFITPKWE